MKNTHLSIQPFNTQYQVVFGFGRVYEVLFTGTYQECYKFREDYGLDAES